MITMEWEKSSLDNFYKRMDTIVSNIVESAEKGLEKALENTQEEALKRKRGSSDKKLLPFNIENKSKFVFEGKLHPDKNTFPHALFLEYGTGRLLDSSGPGPMPNHTMTYRLTSGEWWWVPPELSPTGDWFIATAQPPRPFMRPTGFAMREKNIKTVADEVKKGLI